MPNIITPSSAFPPFMALMWTSRTDSEYADTAASGYPVPLRNVASVCIEGQVTSADDYLRFRYFAESWGQERGTTSSITRMVMCPSYQKIIGMGDRALPFIIAELKATEREPDHWFWALTMITDENPIEDSYRGNLPKMAKAWITWWDRGLNHSKSDN